MSTLVVACDPPVAPWLRRDVESRLVFLDEDVVGAQVVDDGRAIRLLLRSTTSDDRHETIAARARRLLTMLASAIEPRTKVLEVQRTSPPGCNCDLDAWLTEKREVHEEVRGVTALGPRLASLVDVLEARLIDLAHEAGALPYRFPALIDPVLLDRVEAFQHFPHTLGFASRLKRDLDVLERFSAEACASSDGVQAPDDSLAQPSALLTPAVCYHLYGYLENQIIDSAGHVATAQGKCFRHESANMVSLERLWEFTMREIVFVGPAAFVLAGRDMMRQRARELFALLGLDHHVETAHDHFFGAQYWRQSALQTAFELKLEVRASLPHRDKTLAVASYNYHQDFFGRRLSMRLPDGSFAHTSCIAFGLERLAYALLSQHGVDPAGWPAPLRNARSQA